jgi:hypothetical protein
MISAIVFIRDNPAFQSCIGTLNDDDDGGGYYDGDGDDGDGGDSNGDGDNNDDNFDTDNDDNDDDINDDDDDVYLNKLQRKVLQNLFPT